MTNPISTADLVALHLGNHEAPAARSIAGIGEAIGTDAGSVATRIELLSALEDLRDRGLVAERTRAVGRAEGERKVYELTEAGAEYVADRRAALRDREIVVRDDDTERTVTLGAMDQYFDAEPLVRACSRLTEDGVVRLTDGVDQRFVDRETELETLEGLLDAATDGTRGAAIVSGEGGIGKTTLVERAAEIARQRGLTVLSGDCRREADRPYGPIREALEGVDEDRASPFESVAGEVSDYEQFDAQRSVLFTKVTDRFEEIAGDDGLLLTLDDLQWVAESTLALVDQLTASADAGVVVIGTYHPGEIASEGPLATALADELGERAERIDLDAFDRRDTRALIQWVLDTRDVPASFVGAVHEHTGGNPLFIEETVTDMLEEGRVNPEYRSYPESVGEIDVPDEVHAVIETRLDRLDDDGIDVLERGAILGDAFDPEHLVAAASVDEPTAREYIDLLVDAQIWRVTDGGVRFESGVVRTTVLDRLDDDRRRRLHAEVAATIERVREDPSDWHATIASHYTAAGDLERALDHTVAAGDRAKGVYAHEDAIDRYQQALTLASDLDREDRVLGLLEEIADVERVLGRYEDADRNLQYVQERTDDDELLRRVHRKRSGIAHQRGDYDAAVDAADRGLAIGNRDTPEACRLLIAKAGALIESGQDPATQEALLDEAVQLARELDDPELRGHALKARVDRVWRQTPGAVDDDTIATAERAIDLLEEAGDEEAVIESLNSLGAVHHFSGRIREAREYYEKLLTRTDEIGHRRRTLLAKQNLACGLMELSTYRDGDPDPAKQLFEEVIEEGETLAHDPAVVMALMNTVHLRWKGYHRGDAAHERAQEALQRAQAVDAARAAMWSSNFLARLALYVRDDPETAREHADRQVRIAQRAGRGMDTAVGTIHQGVIDREIGEYEAARDRFEAALDVAIEHDLPAQELDARAELVRVHLARDDIETAREHVEQLEARLDDPALDVPAQLRSPVQTGVRRPMLAAHGARPRLARATGDLDRAIRGFEAARGTAVAVDNRRYEVEYGHELGRTLRRAGDHERAREVLSDARDRAADADLRRFQRRCESELDRLDGEE